MKHPRKLTIVMCTLLHGCAINADFDDYGVPLADGDLVGTIPGFPSGDRIENPVIPSVLITENSALGPRGLRVNGEVTFRAGSHERPNRYAISWRGVREGTGSQPSRLHVLDEQGDTAVIVEVFANEIRFVTGEAADAPLQANLSPGGVHEVEILIDEGVANNLAITFDPANGDAETWSALDMLDSDFDKLRAIRVDGQGADYVIDDLIAGLQP
ncbi:MAG: hypothetical protein QNJ91_15040 [Gammaproteobacteria bacterium]|nr:hypothetical protein [Gammaproteobacteria bacterium]